MTGTKNYWVHVSNTCGSVSAQTSVFPHQDVCTPPSVAGQPTPQTIASGASANLSVSALGSQPLFYQWYQGTSTTDTSKPVGTNSAFFTTTPLTQAASFYVKVSNTCGIAFSNVVQVNITGTCLKPSFSIQPASATVVAGSQTYLFAFASDATSYQWYKGALGDLSTPIGSSGPSNDRWVKQVFLDLLGRTPDAATVATYSGLISGGSSRTSVAASILASDEYRQRLMRGIYSVYLHRTPSDAEVNFWLPAFAAGLTDQQVSAQIIASPEYFALAGSTNSGWINAIFNDVLLRSPSASEISAYLTLLGSNSRMSVGLSILNSTEAMNRKCRILL